VYVTLVLMERMHQLADEIRETFDERGWKIDKAVHLDPAFTTTRRPQSSLGRALVLDAITLATSRLGLGIQSVSGGACEVIDIVDGTDRRFRVLKAAVDPGTGEYEMICTSDSILVITDTEPDSFFPAERWVLGYTVDHEGQIVDIFAARVLGITDDAVPRLKLGLVTLLGVGVTTPPSGGGFQPADEDDLGDGFHEEKPGESTAG
jgi:hypothetical protein